MLVPPTRSIGTPYSRSARTTPRWAKPRAPPPESTRPTARPVSSRTTRSKSAGPRRWWWAMPGSASCQRAAAPRAISPLMQDQELCVAHAAVGPSCGSPCGIAGGRARREQHDVGLAQAKLRPRRVAGVARIHHEVARRFALVKPLRAVADRSLPVDEGDSAEARQCAHQPAGLLPDVDAVDPAGPARTCVA